MPVINSTPTDPVLAEPEPLTRDQRIERHLPLVTFTVNRMIDLLSSGVMEREDAIGYGTKGLINAIDNFDPSKGASFATYAVLRIRGAIIDAAREMDVLSRSQRQRMRSLEQTQWDLATQLRRSPTVKELALKTGMSIDEVKVLQNERGARQQSLEQRMSSHNEDYELQLEDPDESTDPAAVVDRQAVSQLLKSAVSSLQQRERDIVEMHYVRGLTLRAIGAKLEISESRTSQLHKRLLSRLRSQLLEKEGFVA